MSHLFDLGLQLERTMLAWRRTGYALLSGSLVATRILSELLGAWASAVGLIGGLAGAALLCAIHRQYRDRHSRLVEHGDRTPIGSGRLVAATSAFCFWAGLIAIGIACHVAGQGRP